MQRDVHAALASHTDDFTISRQIHGVPPHAVYEVTFEGRRAVCKLARGPTADPRTEARVLQHVGRETTVPVPAVLAVGADHFVAAWHDGVPAAENPDAERPASVDWARAAGAGMATLHRETAFDATGLLYGTTDGLTVERHATWSETLREWLRGIRTTLTEFDRAAVVDEALAFVADHRELFDGGGPVLLHGNFMPEHVGVEDGEVTCVVDFEHALVGRGEFDYCRTELEVFDSPRREVPEAIRDAFRAGYESIRPLPRGFERRRPAYRMLVTVAFLESLYVQRQQDRREREDVADWMCELVVDAIADLRAASD